MSDGCIFCKIVRGEAPSFRVREDDLTLAFMDIFPVAHGHTLIIPKQHCTDIFSASEALLSGVAAASLTIARAIDRELSPDGLGIFQLNRAAAGQTVFHYHTHLIPRMTGDTLAIHSRVRGDDGDLAEVARALSAACER